MKHSRRAPFWPTASFHCARPFSLNGQEFAPGDPVPNVTQGGDERLLERLYNQHKINAGEPAASLVPAAAPEPAQEAEKRPAKAEVKPAPVQPKPETDAAQIAPEAPLYVPKNAGFGGWKVVNTRTKEVSGQSFPSKAAAEAEIARLIGKE